MTSIEEIIECVEQNTCADEDDVEQRMYLSQINNCIAEFDVTEYYAAAADFQTANHKWYASDDLFEEAKARLKRIKDSNAVGMSA